MSNHVILLDALLEAQKKEIAKNMSIQDYFEYFAVENVLKDKELSCDEITDGIVDGGDDGGIDSIYIFVNDDLITEEPEDFSIYKKSNVKIEIYAFQTKLSTKYKEQAVEKFNRTVVDLLDMTADYKKLALEYNPEVIEKFKLICLVNKKLIAKFPKLYFYGFYVTKGNTGVIHQKVKLKAERIQSDIMDKILDSTAKFEFWGAEELLLEARRQPKTAFTLDVVEHFQPDKNLAIALCSIKSYFQFLSHENGNMNKSIFESNVRDYQGNVSVNREIRETLTNPTGEDFWWLNNGITILASKMTVSGKEVVIESPEVVNGLQTSNEIFNFFKDGGTDEKRTVLIRIICPDSEESRDRIIKATNSQTQIPNVSLRGTDRIHRDIEDYFETKGLFYDRRKNFYKNEGKPISKIISMSFLGQSLMSILSHKPDTARARPSTLLNNNDEYNGLFNSDVSLDAYYICVRILLDVDSHLKSTSTIQTTTRSDIKFYIALDIATKLIGELPTKNNVLSISVNDIFNVIPESFNKIYTKYVELGGNNKVAKGSELKEWLIGTYK
ncbi:hypothetical protein C9J19_17040 [Photobacterium phosphoreum]|uniref:AIPR family protein n=1 Tax=Photobacterium phosphoreum TaxID=659 RepID=UPI000D1601AD|nr:AIPR family protein [Photobacterium phosphoreum]PSW26372.1 hypothetical protein C9J19_17040 [Photobacterium phosphoreum]